MVYFCVPITKILKKQAIKKSNNYWMLYKILFESFDLKGIMCSYYSFLLKECKRMCKNGVIDFKLFTLKKHVSLHATTCSLCQFNEK
jgi:NAD-dependent dihydropyrimidine dehydrogenase PreA subunit